MKTPKKIPRDLKKKKKLISLFVVTVVVTLLVAGIVAGVHKVNYYDTVADKSNIVGIRELVLQAVRGVKKNAPVEPKTGDVYFPESRFVLPNPGMALTLTYFQDTGDIADSQGGLSVSTYPVRASEALYSATDMDSLFKAIPKLQSCSRGIKLVRAQFPQDDAQNELVHTVRLNNGQDLYIYVEKDCPELRDTADLFKNIQAY